jgi:hypothetical protein
MTQHIHSDHGFQTSNWILTFGKASIMLPHLTSKFYDAYFLSDVLVVFVRPIARLTLFEHPPQHLIRQSRYIMETEPLCHTTDDIVSMVRKPRRFPLARTQVAAGAVLQ